MLRNNLGMEKRQEKSKLWKKLTLFEKTEINMKITKIFFFLTTLIRKIMKFWSTLVILACILQISTNFLSIFYKTTGLIKTNPPHQFSQLKLHKLPIYGKVFVLPKYYRSYRWTLDGWFLHTNTVPSWFRNKGTNETI